MPVAAAVAAKDHDVRKVLLQVWSRVVKPNVLEGKDSEVILAPPTLSAVAEREELNQVRRKFEINLSLGFTDRLECRGWIPLQRRP